MRLSNPFESLESPFLTEELLSTEPAESNVASEPETVQSEDTWQEAEEAEEAEAVEEAEGAVDLLGGKLSTFTTSTVPMRVSVFCPAAVKPGKPIDMLVYVHGDLNGCAPYPKTVPEDLITKAPFHLGQIIEDSKRPIALVVPSMDWANLKTNKLGFVACNRPDASLHVLGIPENLNGVMKEALAEIGRVLSSPAPTVANLILAGHSRAHGFFNALALHHSDPEMRKGVLATIKEVWCLDSTYFCFMAEWERWMLRASNLVVSVFHKAGGTAAYAKKLGAVGKTISAGKVVVQAVSEGHCHVPAKRIPELLKRSPHATALEISDELESDPLIADLEEWEQPSVDEQEASEFENIQEEVLGNDTRTLIGNTLAVPNRWICAIDILTDNPDWPQKGSKYVAKSRGTGILIGPKYVLTARHVVENFGLLASSPVREIYVSPARNGDNSSNPFGRVKAATVQHSAQYRVPQADGSRRLVRDDYALIILEKNLDTATHSKLKGTLDYWGKDPALAKIQRLDPTAIDKKDIAVTGYPGDTCGTTKFTGSAASKERQIDNCWLRRNDEWASRQWTGTGTLDVVSATSRVLLHTADTYKGQSGAPITLTLNGELHLVGIHTDADNPHRNRGYRLTRLMLQEIADWINADAGYTMASIQNDALVLQPASAGSGAKSPTKELENEFEEEFEEELDFENDDEFVAIEGEDEEDEADFSYEGPFEERFDPDVIENTGLQVSAKYVRERDPMFAGDSGGKFKAMVEQAAQDVDLNPGFLAAVLLAEWDKRSLYLSSKEVTSFVSGTDDFYAMRGYLKDNVPAYSKVHFDPVWTVDINEHNRKVKTITFKTGKDALLATAVYLKYAEIKLRKAAAKNGGDFDTFSVETRFALVRVAMASGHGGITPEGEFVWFKRKNGRWVKAKKGDKGAVLRGVAPRLATVLNGGDFLVRKNEPRRNPTNSAHITNRNATILASQAMHLSESVFGIPLTASEPTKEEEFEACPL